MNSANLIFLVIFSLLGIIYFYIGLTKKDYPLLICGFFLAVYAFFVRDIIWLSLAGFVLLVSPFMLSRYFIPIINRKEKTLPSFWNSVNNCSKEGIMDPILLRRSIRKYNAKSIPQEIIEYLLEAAMSAPSAGNEAPWFFIVLNSKSMLEKIAAIHTNGKMLKDAPLAITVCCDLNLEKNNGFWVQDCSAATENILLAAQTKGLGSVWLGVYPKQDRIENIKKLLWLPENVVPFSIVALGYPAEEKPYQKRYNSQRIKYNGW